MTNEEKALTFAARKVVGHYLLDVGAEKIDAALLELQLAVQDFEKAKEASFDAVREAKIEAYEEAAKVADEIEDSMAEAIAERIRALKDSHTQEEG
jgi:hypothetical protein